VIGDPAVGAVAIEELVAAVGLWDGLALDFEGLDASLRGPLSQFIDALGSALRAAGKSYAIALPAKASDIRTGWSGAYDYAAIAGAADFYLVMAYGYRSSSSSIPGSTAPIAWVDASMAYAASVIAPERLILGVAFYGYDWNITQGPPARALRHSDTRQLLAATGARPTLDPQTMSATFRYELDGEEHEVWFEDARSVAAKLRLGGRHRLAGVGAWRLGQEDPATWDSWDLLLARPATRVQGPLPAGQAARPVTAVGGGE
jgi:spore germination protein YaaH